MPTFKCSHCGKDLEDNKPYFSVNLGKEVYGDDTITVLFQDSVQELCLSCAELYDLRAIQVPLKQKGKSQRHDV